MQILRMPDELSTGHLGRISFIKGNRASISQATDYLQFRRALGGNGLKKTFLEQLAEHSEMDSTAYAAKHSMLPVMRPASRNDSHRLHGDPKNITLNRKYGVVIPTRPARLCPHCVEEDRVEHGYSWYKRIHHLEGIDWCVRHQTPLVRVVSDNRWARNPEYWLDTTYLEPESSSHDDSDSGFLDRYAEIHLAFLGKTKPYFVCDLGMMLGLRVKLRLASMGARATGVLLSDMVKAAVPSSWATKHWPELMEKAPGEHLQGLDSVITNIEVPISCLAYSAILATLFETTAEALELLADLDQQRFLSSISNWVNQSNQTEESTSCLDCAV